MFTDTAEDDEWDLDSPVLPQSLDIEFPGHAHPRRRSDCTQSASFFRLPLELRNDIYRHLVISPLSQSLPCQLHRAVCVDDTVFRIGYFRRDTILPLLLICRQIHAEASTILYSENIFSFHATNLTPHPLAFLGMVSHHYLESMRNAYLLTEFFTPERFRSYAWPNVPSSDEDEDRKELRKRRDAIFQLELTGSIAVAQKALHANCGFLINTQDTIRISTGISLGRLERVQEELEPNEWWSSSCQLWKMVLVKSGNSEHRQEFRRIIWANDEHSAED